MNIHTVSSVNIDEGMSVMQVYADKDVFVGQCAGNSRRQQERLGT